MNERTRQQAAKMGSKVHYRAYKVGKHWLVAGISSLALAGVLLSVGATQASAATDEIGTVDDQASQTTTAGTTLNQKEVPLTSTTADDTTVASSGNEAEAVTEAVDNVVATPEGSDAEVTTPEATPDREAVVADETEQTATTNDSNMGDTSATGDKVQTHHLGTASDEVADTVKAQAEQAYAVTGQAQQITRMAADEDTGVGHVSLTVKTTDDELVLLGKFSVPVGDSVILSNLQEISDISPSKEKLLRMQVAEYEAKKDETNAFVDEVELGDSIAGRYQFVNLTNDITGEVSFNPDSLNSQLTIDENGVRAYAYTIIVKKTPYITVDHVYTDGSDATGATSSPQQIILTVSEPVDETSTEENTITATFGENDQAKITTSKLTDNPVNNMIVATLLGGNGIKVLSNATIQQNLRNIGIRMDGTVDTANLQRSLAIKHVTYVYDKDAVAETPVTDANQDLLDTLKDLYEQAMAIGDGASNEGESTTDPNGDSGEVTQANVGIAFYLQNTETGEITPFAPVGNPLVDWQLYDKDTTLPLDMAFSFKGVNYRYVGYEIAPADGSIDGSQLNPDNELVIKTGALVAGVDETGQAIEVAPTMLVNAVYQVVPAEITVNYVYDDADQTQIKPTQTVTTEQKSDVTLPTTTLEEIVLTANQGKNGVPTTVTLKFNSNFTVTHLILNEGTDHERVLPAAYETLGAFLANNVDDADLSQAILDELAVSGIGEDTTNPDFYQGFLANLAKTGIHINGNVSIANPEIYTQLRDVTYVYATPDKQPVTIQAVDDVTGDVLETAELTGYPDFTTTYDTQALIDKYTAMNYVVAANDIPEVITFDDDAAVAQVYQLHLTHHITHSTAETTQTVTFTDEDGKTMTPSVDETITWNVSTDDVTGDKVATAQKSYDAVDAPVIEDYVATPNVVVANYPAATKGELADTTVQVIYKKKAAAGNGGATTPGGTDVTQPGTDQSTVTTPETEQPTVVEPSGDSAPETEQPAAEEQPAAGVDGEGADTPETLAVSSNGTATGDADAANGQAVTGQFVAGKASDADAQRLPQTAERDGRVDSVMGLALAGMLSLIGLSGLRKKRD